MKNILIGILSVVLVGFWSYGYYQTIKVEELTFRLSESEALKKQVEQYRTEAAELQKMYDQVSVEMQVQRTICEEQIKALKNK